MRAVFSLLLLLPVAASAFAQTARETPLPGDPLQREWSAAWVTHPTAPLREPLVLHFKKSLILSAVPPRYVVRVSADNRFILWVNGKRVGDGPARGDLNHWRYERFDLAPMLKAGENLITATVWNFGVLAPVAQMSDRTAFLLESEMKGKEGISTPNSWMVEEEKGQRPLDRSAISLREYMAAGPGEEMDAAKYDWDWNDPSAAGAGWVPVGDPMRESVFPGTNHAHSAQTTGDNLWGLVPDELPHMEYEETSAGKNVLTEVFRASPGQKGDDVDLDKRTFSPGMDLFPATPMTIPAKCRVHLLLDRKTLTTGYPQITVSGGRGANIRITYSEALYDKQGHKGDRDAVTGRKALGLVDRFLPDGGAHRTFEPLWWRTWRYMDLEIETADKPLELEPLKAWFTAYPFQERAQFQTSDEDLKKIWEISWRTARLDAHETYMDTPYYEQLQYVGDTRIQALISYAVAGDDRLARQALSAFNDSRFPAGLTRSRYPSSLPQTIPTFSLLWIGMLHDYWIYRPDPQPVRDSLEGTRTVLHWFAGHERPDGLLERLPWWSFIDWVLKGETPTYSADGESCMTTLEYLGALNDAADLEQHLGDSMQADQERTRAAHVKAGIYAKCWNEQRGLIADNPDQKIFSQQANLLAVLYDVVPQQQEQPILRKLLAIEPGTTPDGVMSASYYFRFYLARAMDHAGLADEYLNSLGPWRALLPLHFSTWPEQPGDTRSDSHAWSAHPIYDMLTLVAGVEPASPGFASVRIAPHLGALTELRATFPHPQGMIDIQYQKRGNGLDATVTLPGTLSGTFVYDGKTQPLTPGVNHIQAQ